MMHPRRKHLSRRRYVQLMVAFSRRRVLGGVAAACAVTAGCLNTGASKSGKTTTTRDETDLVISNRLERELTVEFRLSTADGDATILSKEVGIAAGEFESYENPIRYGGEYKITVETNVGHDYSCTWTERSEGSRGLSVEILKERIRCRQYTA